MGAVHMTKQSSEILQHHTAVGLLCEIEAQNYYMGNGAVVLWYPHLLHRERAFWVGW